MNEKFQNAIEKIVLLARQNAEFDTALRKRLKMTSSATTATSIDDKRISHIEKYLGLDYYVDSKNSIIDYSFVTMPDIREQLVSDNREMMRFRYGTRYHEIDFPEFCRFAHLQSEMLLNYYYDKTNDSDLNSICEHIRRYNSKASLGKSSTLAAIPYNTKLWAFIEEFKSLQIPYYVLSYLRKMRNELSHRSTEKENKLQIEEYQKLFKSLNIPLYPDGHIDRNAYKQLKNRLENSIGMPDSDQYDFLVWRFQKPFDQIIEQLRLLSKTVADNT